MTTYNFKFFISFSISNTIINFKAYLSYIIYIMKVVIAGGGICGLTLALAAKKAGINPIVIEQRKKS